MEYTYHELANIFPLIEGKEFDELVTDIASNGQLEAIIVLGSEILDGRNRYRACIEAGLTPRIEEYTGATNTAALLSVVMSYNMHRRHLNSNQSAFVALKVMPYLEKIAKENQGTRNDLDLNFKERIPESNKQSRDTAAAMFKTNPRYIQDAKRIAKERPEQAEEIKRGETTIPKVMKEIKKEKARTERVERIQGINAGNEELDLSKTYPVIYADPPWRYEHVKTNSRAIENQYPTMALGEICDLPVNEIAAEDAVLLMWATSPKLAEAMQVIESWGFTYRTSLVWVKDKIGMGYYVRGRHELLLIATRGSLPVPEPANRFDSVLESPRQDHSQKPLILYDYIEAMYPEYAKIELFCRTPQPGWDVWGNQSSD